MSCIPVTARTGFKMNDLIICLMWSLPWLTCLITLNMVLPVQSKFFLKILMITERNTYETAKIDAVIVSLDLSK